MKESLAKAGPFSFRVTSGVTGAAIDFAGIYRRSYPCFDEVQNTREGVGKMVPSTTHLFGIEPADWLNAGVTSVGMLLAILTAVWISPWISRRQSRHDNRERLLRMLMNTRLIPANPDYQTAIAMIPLEFKGSQLIAQAHRRYLETVNTKIDQMTPEEATRHNETTTVHQNQLIAAMAKVVGFPEITAETLKSGAYLSAGFVNREQMLLEAMQAWPRIAAAIENTNRISIAYYGASLQVPIQDKPNPEPPSEA